MTVGEVRWLAIVTDAGLEIDGPFAVSQIEELSYHLSNSRDDIKRIHILSMAPDWKISVGSGN